MSLVARNCAIRGVAATCVLLPCLVSVAGATAQRPFALSDGLHQPSLLAQAQPGPARATKDQAGGKGDIFRAAESGDLARVRALISSGTNVNAKDKDGWTPLMFAAVAGHRKVAELLINMGAELNSLTADGSTPLMGASLTGRAEIVELLLKVGADPNLKRRNGTTALDMAKQRGHAEVISLLSAKTTVPPRDSEGSHSITPNQGEGPREQSRAKAPPLDPATPPAALRSSASRQLYRDIVSLSAQAGSTSLSPDQRSELDSKISELDLKLLGASFSEKSTTGEERLILSCFLKRAKGETASSCESLAALLKSEEARRIYREILTLDPKMERRTFHDGTENAVKAINDARKSKIIDTDESLVLFTALNKVLDQRARIDRQQEEPIRHRAATANGVLKPYHGVYQIGKCPAPEIGEMNYAIIKLGQWIIWSEGDTFFLNWGGNPSALTFIVNASVKQEVWVDRNSGQREPGLEVTGRSQVSEDLLVRLGQTFAEIEANGKGAGHRKKCQAL